MATASPAARRRGECGLSMYYVYILQSKQDGNLYIGKTKDLRTRIEYHNRGKVIATKGRRPLDLIFYEAFRNSTDASRDELFYKSGYAKEILKNKLKFTLIRK